MVRNSFFNFPIYNITENGLEKLIDAVNDDIKIVLLVDESDMNEANEKLISGILKATKTPPNQITKITIPTGQEMAIGSQLKVDNKMLLLSFGIPPKRMGYNINRMPYTEHKLDQLSIYFCHTLTELSSNQTFKKQLWAFLQKYLGI